MGVRLLGKMKLYELAKELNISSKELIDKAKEIGINVKSHLSSLDDKDIVKLKDNISKPVKETVLNITKIIINK